MYKVFINDKTIYLVKKTTYTESPTMMMHQYQSKQLLWEVFKNFKDNNQLHDLVIYGMKKKKLLKKFISLFKFIEAGGGLVKNKNGQYLFIFRRGRWDLPKGKTESFESMKKTALREVQEECGINELQIVKKIFDTYHIYERKGQWIIKKTYWYEMFHHGNEQPVPETTEDITKAVWVEKEEIEKLMENTFKSVDELVDRYFNINIA